MRGVILSAAAFGAAMLSASGSARAQEAADGEAGAAPAQEETAGAAKNEDADAAAKKPPRPPLPPQPAAEPPLWARRLDIGGDVAFVARPASATSEGAATGIRYRTAIGFGLHARWDLFRYLRFTAYFVDTHHTVLIPQGSLGVGGQITLDAAKTYAFGARLSPTLPLGDRGRVWVTSGVGWGRLELGRMSVQEPGREAFEVRERSMSFVEVPVGLGASFEIVPRWLAVEIEVTGAFVLSQEGNALHDAQAIDTAGRKRVIGSFPEMDASFVQTLGLSLLL